VRVVRRTLAVLLGVALAAQPAVASAALLVHRDPAGDVVRSPVGSSAGTPAPTQVDGDIVATRVLHARRAIWIQVRFRDLAAKGNGNFHRISIRTPWRVRNIALNAFPSHWEGSATTTNGHGRVVACAVTHLIDYDRHRLKIRVPRACLGAPTWVRVAIRSTVAGATYAYTDDARSDGLPPHPVYGRRIPL
jgi:hypothetical protein